jgi:DNA-binding CsgD family transcriptional regulator
MTSHSVVVTRAHSTKMRAGGLLSHNRRQSSVDSAVSAWIRLQLARAALAGRTSPLDELTFAERAITDHLLRGLSNVSISHIRHTSRNTVAKQVASIYRTLGVGSRRQLIGLVRSLGGWPGTTQPPLERCKTTLTPREFEVLSRAESGASSKEIAYELHISSATVRVLLARARKRMESPE